jgi:hypothetical protein
MILLGRKMTHKDYIDIHDVIEGSSLHHNHTILEEDTGPYAPPEVSSDPESRKNDYFFEDGINPNLPLRVQELLREHQSEEKENIEPI